MGKHLIEITRAAHAHINHVDLETILLEVVDERNRQCEKWGTQNTKNNGTWLAIAMDRFGTIARDILDTKHWANSTTRRLRIYRAVVQLAAVMVAWAESLLYRGVEKGASDATEEAGV